MNNDDVVQVQLSCDDRQTLDAIAEDAVANSLAACAQVLGPVRSHFRWEGVLTAADQWLCLLKTTRSKLPELTVAVASRHPDDLPEFLVVPCEGSTDFLAWIRDETR